MKRIKHKHVSRLVTALQHDMRTPDDEGLIADRVNVRLLVDDGPSVVITTDWSGLWVHRDDNAGDVAERLMKRAGLN